MIIAGMATEFLQFHYDRTRVGTLYYLLDTFSPASYCTVYPFHVSSALCKQTCVWDILL